MGGAEYFGIELDAGVCGIDTGTAAGGFLGVARMRCAVGAEEKLGIAAHRRLDQRLAIFLTLEYRQAVVMGPDAARKQRIAVEQQMVRGDGSRDPRRRTKHKTHRLPGRDVLEHDAQP